jgi:hypothetical protein
MWSLMWHMAYTTRVRQWPLHKQLGNGHSTEEWCFVRGPSDAAMRNSAFCVAQLKVSSQGQWEKQNSLERVFLRK